MSLSETDITKQIENMIAFIQQEAAEKVEEIEAKTEEEFNIEKSRLVSQQRVKIIDYYDKKEKQIELQQKIQHSKVANASRLSILKARDDYVRSLKEEAREELKIVIEDRSKYITFLANLIVEGLLILMESSVEIRCRQDDFGLVQRLIPDTINKYQVIFPNQSISVSVDQQNFLSNEIIGGIQLYAAQRTIKVSNTLDDRLSLLFEQMIPTIKQKLFGRNPNLEYEC